MTRHSYTTAWGTTVLDDAGADLDQPLAQGSELGSRERTGGRQPRSQGVHDPVGRRVQDEAHLVGVSKKLRECNRFVDHDTRRLSSEVLQAS
jgi:hypothetical protein